MVLLVHPDTSAPLVPWLTQLYLQNSPSIVDPQFSNGDCAESCHDHGYNYGVAGNHEDGCRCVVGPPYLLKRWFILLTASHRTSWSLLILSPTVIATARTARTAVTPLSTTSVTNTRFRSRFLRLPRLRLPRPRLPPLLPRLRSQSLRPLRPPPLLPLLPRLRSL
jgi:hypothetical protein